MIESIYCPLNFPAPSHFFSNLCVEDVNAEKIAQLVDIFQVPEQRARQALTACFGGKFALNVFGIGPGGFILLTSASCAPYFGTDVDNAAAWIADNNISDSDADFSHKGSVHSSLWGVD